MKPGRRAHVGSGICGWQMPDIRVPRPFFPRTAGPCSAQTSRARLPPSLGQPAPELEEAASPSRTVQGTGDLGSPAIGGLVDKGGRRGWGALRQSPHTQGQCYSHFPLPRYAGRGEGWGSRLTFPGVGGETGKRPARSCAPCAWPGGASHDPSAPAAVAQCGKTHACLAVNVPWSRRRMRSDGNSSPASAGVASPWDDDASHPQSRLPRSRPRRAVALPSKAARRGRHVPTARWAARKLRARTAGRLCCAVPSRGRANSTLISFEGGSMEKHVESKGPCPLSRSPG